MRNSSFEQQNDKSRSGLSALEVIVVLGCLLLVAMLVIPRIVTQRERQRTVACKDRLRQLGIASFQFADENDDRFPALVEHDDPWTWQLLPYLDTDGSILDKLAAANITERKVVTVPAFLCPNGREYPPGAGCYVVNGGWGDSFRYDAETDKVFEETPLLPEIDWNGDGTVSPAEVAQSRATGLIWRTNADAPAWTRKEVEQADGLGQTILFSENQNVAQWLSTKTFDLAFVVGIGGIEFGPPETPFSIQKADLGPYRIDANRGTLIGYSPSPSSLHPTGVNVLYADGSVDSFTPETDPIIYLRLMTPNGAQYGEPTFPQEEVSPASAKPQSDPE